MYRKQELVGIKVIPTVVKVYQVTLILLVSYYGVIQETLDMVDLVLEMENLMQIQIVMHIMQQQRQ